MTNELNFNVLRVKERFAIVNVLVDYYQIKLQRFWGNVKMSLIFWKYFQRQFNPSELLWLKFVRSIKKIIKDKI